MARTGMARNLRGLVRLPFGVADGSMDLALFDFDGTITTRGTYPEFVRFAARPARKIVGGVLLAPLILGYRVGFVSDRTVRAAISRVAFWRADPNRLKALGERFATDVLPGTVRSEAFERIRWHQARGDRVVVVSAALDVYLEPWGLVHGVDVICTRLEVVGGRCTGRYVRGDCCGDEKARRARERYTLGEFEMVYAYGDTDEDQAMLAMADRPYYRWREVARPAATANPL
jgi:phosphatidylglycerophosphatase C